MKQCWVHIIFFKGEMAICPKCGGMVTARKSDEVILQCFDCATFYKAIGFGKAEAEFLCEEVTVG